MVLRDAIEGNDEEPAVAAAAPPAPSRWPWLVSAVLAVGLIVSWLPRGGSVSESMEGFAPNSRLSISLPDGRGAMMTNNDFELMPAIAVSSTGSRVAYVAEGLPRLLQVRSIDDLSPQNILGTDFAEVPFFSADGEWIAFFDGSRLAKVPATGGTSVEVTKCGSGAGGA